MGRAPRPRPSRLGGKLLHIRRSLGLTQQQLIESLDYRRSPLFIGQISQFEQNKREPPVLVILHYARIAGVPLEAIVDDNMNLPKKKKRTSRLSQTERRGPELNSNAL